MKTAPLRFISLITAFSISTAAIAEVYSCGPGCYTSNPKESKGKANLGNKIGSYRITHNKQTDSGSRNKAEHTAKAPSAPRPNTTAAPAQAAPLPLAQSNTARNEGRRKILEQELANERAALANAQKALAESRIVNGTSDAAHQNQIRRLENTVLDRQQNIQALQKELGRM